MTKLALFFLLASVFHLVTCVNVSLPFSSIYCEDHYFKEESDSMLEMPIIFFITPTHSRPNQYPELIRIGHLLSTVPRLHWIVVEDAVTKDIYVERILQESKVWRYTHTAAASSANSFHRGVDQRNAGISHVMSKVLGLDENAPNTRGIGSSIPEVGVVYFGDDDNTLVPQAFPEMRRVRRVGVWPVGWSAGKLYERCVVRKGEVQKILTGWVGGRSFPVDMASFATHTDELKRYYDTYGVVPLFRHTVSPGKLEETWLSYFLYTLSELEPLADECRYLNVWHSQTEVKELKSSRRSRRVGGR